MLLHNCFAVIGSIVILPEVPTSHQAHDPKDRADLEKLSAAEHHSYGVHHCILAPQA